MNPILQKLPRPVRMFIRRMFAPPPPRTMDEAMPISAQRWADLRPDDRFLVSYPRSGNTWVRFLLRDIIVSGRPDLPVPDDIDALLPEAHDDPPDHPAIAQFGAQRILKSHNVTALRGRPMAYLFRQPADVVVSQYHAMCNFHRDGAKVSATGIDAFCSEAVNRWKGHVESALEMRRELPDKVAFFCYELLAERGTPILRRMARQLGLAASDETLTAILERNTIDHLRKQRPPKDRDPRFFRKGKVGSSKEELQPQTLTLIEQVAGETYRRARAAAEEDLQRDT